MIDPIRIGIIGDFDKTRSSHLATNNALEHCSKALGIYLDYEWLPTELLTGPLFDQLHDFDGLWCSPGSPYRNYHGALRAIRFAREYDYPFIGTCGGFQHAVMEYAQNVLGIHEVYHAEYNPDASSFFISALSCSLVGETRKISLKKPSIVQQIYEKNEIIERYNCSFGLNVSFQDMFDQSGFHVSGTDENDEVRIFEIPQNRFYIATLFQPQLSSTPETPHKLIQSYLRAAEKFHSERFK